MHLLRSVKWKGKVVLLCALLALVLLWVYPAAAQDKQWVDLVTGVSNNSPVTTRAFGYYADVKGFGHVFIICDPNTGEETGYAYVPGGVVGAVKKQAIDHYDRKQDLDWDHPKQVNPPQIALTAPNIPTSTEWDWNYFQQTGQTVKKAVNQFGWPMSYSFAHMIPGSDPNYWLIVASVSNSNPYPVNVSFDARIWEWTSSWWSSGAISKNLSISLGPNETKYVLLNVGQKDKYLAYELWNDWPTPGMSLAYYNTTVTQINDPDYPDILKSGDKYGFFTPYVRWDGTDPMVIPLIPMRLAFEFYCYGGDYSAAWYGSSDPTSGRGWYPVWGQIEYDPTTEQWSLTNIYIDPDDYRPYWWSDQQWNNFVQKTKSNVETALKRVFSIWYPKVPFLCSWWDDYLYVDGNTGYYYFSYEKKGWPNGQRPDFVIGFSYLEPVAPSKLPPGAKSLEEIYGPWWWLINVRYGGWLYTTGGPYSYGVELPAPVLSSYRRTYYRGESAISEFNYQIYSDRDRDGDTDEVCVPRGTGIYIRSTDVRYYDPNDWMDIIPVLEARPLFIEWYTFVPTQGDIGYLKKDVVPGYLLQVDREHRPVLNVLTHPVEVRARCGYADWRNNGYRDVWREWRWTPNSGWQYLGETVGSTYQLSRSTAVWELTFNYNHVVSGNNPAEFPASWTGPWGGVPSLYWPGKDALSTKIANMADWVEVYDRWKRKYTTQPRIDYINIDPSISLPVVPTLAPYEQSKWLASCNKTASVRFWKSPTKYEWWDSYQNRVLNEIASNIIQPIFSSQEEAVFNNGGKFVMTPTFKTGQGGIINGALKSLIHKEYTWYSKYEMYVWDHLTWNTIGFPGAGMTHCSYVTYASPTDGLVVKGGDDYLADVLSQKWTEIRFGPYGDSGTCSSRQWRYYYNGTVYPPPYPED